MAALTYFNLLRPFNYIAVTKPYTEMKAAWDDLQLRLGFVASVCAATNIATTLSIMVMLFYYRELQRFNVSYTPATVWIYATFVLIMCCPPLVLSLYSMITANDCAAAIADEISLLIGHPGCPAAVPGAQSVAVDPSAAWDSESALRQVEFGMGVMRLSALVERRPCELRLVGRKITWADITSAIGVIVATQSLNILGLGGGA